MNDQQPKKVNALNTHESFIKRCCTLAYLAEGHTLTNPRVGAVLVFNNTIIGEGYHRGYGQPHAEVMALRSVAHQDQWKIEKSTLFVSLEPCCIHGKTPPCTDLIIRSKIPELVIGSLDPNPAVSGKGIAKLKKAGIKVTSGVLKEACDQLIYPFYINQCFNRPYIILKFARSLDGFIGKNGERIFLSNELVNKLTHKLRGMSQGIAIGKNTATNDLAELTTRNYPGPNPIRVIFSRSGRIPADLQVFNRAASTILITDHPVRNLPYGITALKSTGSLKGDMEFLYRHFRISSIIIEGGADLLEQFIKKKLWDEIIEIVCPVMLMSGIAAPNIPPLYLTTQLSIVDNVLITHRKKA